MYIPKVSIIIPTYKRSLMLKRAIDSVLNQSYSNIEVIVVDDNNPDTIYRQQNESFMKHYLDNPKVIYLKHEKNLNGAVARNTGIKVAQGQYIGFLDDDDEFHKDKIEIQVNKLKAMDKSYGAVYCGYECYRGNKLIMKSNSIKEGNLVKDLLLMKWGTGSGSNVLFRKEVIAELNGFDPLLKRHQDWDILIRMFRKYKIAKIESPLLKIYKDSRMNVPNVETFIEVKKYFFNKIETDLSKFPKEIRDNIYQVHALEICTAFIKNRSYLSAKKCYEVANKFKKVSIKDNLTLFLIVIYMNIPYREKILIQFGALIEKFRIIKS